MDSLEKLLIEYWNRRVVDFDERIRALVRRGESSQYLATLSMMRHGIQRRIDALRKLTWDQFKKSDEYKSNYEAGRRDAKRMS